MDPDKTFCLKWNNFQQNIFSTIRNLRLDLDFLDVTLYCKGKQLKAHKVILSACSNTFRSILKETQAPHPVIVLWDVDSRDISALLDFMYNGQVDIQQDDLERFLIVAERLQVRGLSGEETEPSENTRKRHLETVSQVFSSAAKQRRNNDSQHSNKVQTKSDHLVIHNHHPETRELHENPPRVEIKTENNLENNHVAHNNVVTIPHRSPVHHNSAVGPLKKRNLNTNDNHHVIINNHKTEEEYAPETVDYPGDNNHVEYPLEQTDNYEEYYDEEGSYNNTSQYPIDYSMDNSPGKGASKSVKCPYCDKVLKYRHNLKGHIQNQHGAGEPEAPCPICPDKIFKNSASLRDHMSRKHRGEKAALAAAVNAQDKLSSAAGSTPTAASLRSGT